MMNTTTPGGDLVSIMELGLSKTKRWRLERPLSGAK